MNGRTAKRLRKQANKVGAKAVAYVTRANEGGGLRVEVDPTSERGRYLNLKRKVRR